MLDRRRRHLLWALTAGWASSHATTVEALDEQGKVDNTMARHWRARQAAFAAEPVVPGGIVFLGDSMTERFDLAHHFPAWPAGELINRGIGGDKVGGWRYLGLLDRLDRSVHSLAPRQVVLMIGVNDLVFAATPAPTLAAAYATLLDRLHESGAAVLVQPVLPVRGAWAGLNPAIAAFNSGVVRPEAARRGMPVLDLAPALADASGALRAEMASDDIHLSAAGYRAWALALEPRLLRRCTGDKICR